MKLLCRLGYSPSICLGRPARRVSRARSSAASWRLLPAVRRAAGQATRAAAAGAFWRSRSAYARTGCRTSPTPNSGGGINIAGSNINPARPRSRPRTRPARRSCPAAARRPRAPPRPRTSRLSCWRSRGACGHMASSASRIQRPPHRSAGPTPPRTPSSGERRGLPRRPVVDRPLQPGVQASRAGVQLPLLYAARGNTRSARGSPSARLALACLALAQATLQRDRA